MQMPMAAKKKMSSGAMRTNIIMMSLPGAVSAAMTATRTTTQRQDFRMVLPRIRPSMLMPTRMTGMMKAQEKVTTNFRMKEMYTPASM